MALVMENVTNGFIQDLETRNDLLMDCFEFLNGLDSKKLMQQNKLNDCIELVEVIQNLLYEEEY